MIYVDRETPGSASYQAKFLGLNRKRSSHLVFPICLRNPTIENLTLEQRQVEREARPEKWAKEKAKPEKGLTRWWVGLPLTVQTLGCWAGVIAPSGNIERGGAWKGTGECF